MRRAALVRASIVLLGTVIAATRLGCSKSSETEAAEAAKAAAIKQDREWRAFEELRHGDTRSAAQMLVESQEADEKAAREQQDVREAVKREQHRLRALLTKEMVWVDRWIADTQRVALSVQGPLRAEKEADSAVAREWRERLGHDLEALDLHPQDAEDWAALRKRIERDLEDDRPSSVPRSYETPYGI